jgi:hypothetical protein
VLHQANLSLELLPLCLQGDGHATSKDHIDLIHMLLIVGIGSMMFPSARLLHRLWWWHLLVTQKSSTFFQIMPCDMMNLTPLLRIGRAMERTLLLLICGLLLLIPVISMIGCVDLLIILLLLCRPLAM